MEKFPNFFIVGAPKAGTTSLHEYLKQIPGIFMSPVKEPYYFCRKIIMENDPILNPIRDKNKYLALFEDAKNEKILGESTTHYLADPDAAKLIYEVSPNAKILISLRDPVEREFSHYLMLYNRGLLNFSFNDELKREVENSKNDLEPTIRINSGLYSQDIKRYLKIFGEKQVKIIIFEEWKNNIQKVIDEILTFLGLENVNYNLKVKIYNKYTGKKIPRGNISKQILKSKKIGLLARIIIPFSERQHIGKKILTTRQERLEMNGKDRQTLVDYYKDDVNELETMLGRKLPWKNFA